MPADASTAPVSEARPALSRRAFLTSRLTPPAPEFRPPWTDEARMAAHCTGCNACAEACPEAIIELDARNLARINLRGGECSFCGACAEACPAPVFDLSQDAPWPVTAAISGTCLLGAGITCQLCTDSCDAGALRMDLSVRPAGAIRLDAEACTGCGACLPTCPNSAIALCDARQQRMPA